MEMVQSSLKGLMYTLNWMQFGAIQFIILTDTTLDRKLNLLIKWCRNLLPFITFPNISAFLSQSTCRAPLIILLNPGRTMIAVGVQHTICIKSKKKSQQGSITPVQISRVCYWSWKHMLAIDVRVYIELQFNHPTGKVSGCLQTRQITFCMTRLQNKAMENNWPG